MSIVDKINNLILIYNQQINLESLRVITDLKWLLSYIEENPVVVEPQEEIKIKVKKEQTSEIWDINLWEASEVNSLNNFIITETKEENNIAEKAMEYLKSIKAKGIYNYKSEEKLIARAIKEWFTI